LRWLPELTVGVALPEIVAASQAASALAPHLVFAF
jgi:hypothetical protein